MQSVYFSTSSYFDQWVRLRLVIEVDGIEAVARVRMHGDTRLRGVLAHLLSGRTQDQAYPIEGVRQSSVLPYRFWGGMEQEERASLAQPSGQRECRWRRERRGQEKARPLSSIVFDELDDLWVVLVVEPVFRLIWIDDHLCLVIREFSRARSIGVGHEIPISLADDVHDWHAHWNLRAIPIGILCRAVPAGNDDSSELSGVPVGCGFATFAVTEQDDAFNAILLQLSQRVPDLLHSIVDRLGESASAAPARVTVGNAPLAFEGVRSDNV